MRVFSNTTPFIALASIDQLQLLPQLFGSVYVAQSVIEECAEGGRILVPNLQGLSWVISMADESSSNLPVLFDLDRGEKQTLLLASKHPGSTVIIDERLGRNVAEYMGLQVTGTLGVLAKAKTMGFIPSFYAAAQGMREEGIHYSMGLIDRLAQHLGEIDS